MTAGRTALDRALAPALAANAAAVLAFLYLPIAVLLILSFSASRYATVWGGFSLRWYEELAADREIGRALGNSLVIAGSVAAVSTVLGTLAAMGLERLGRTRSTARWDVAVMVPIMVPDIVQGIALLMFFVLCFGTGALGRTTVIAAHTAFAFAYVTVVVRARLAGIGRTLEEAAMDLGATPVRVFLRVTLPLLWPAVLGGALLAFTLSLDEFVITFFTSGPDAATLPLHVRSMVKRGITPKINALASLLVVASVALVSLSALLQRRRS